MQEKAFKVKKGSDFYRKYFEMNNERQKFQKLAFEFFKNWGLYGANRYALSTRLSVELTPECANQLSDQITQGRRNGLYRFKLHSPLQKAWEQAVISKCDMELIGSLDIWYFDYIHHGSYSLWHNGDELYGYLSDDVTDIQLPDFFIPLKMSEYYAIIERIEENEL